MRLLPYDKNRGKRCCSCGDMVCRGAKYIQVERWRECVSDIEQRIYGDEVPLASWVICESCAPIFVIWWTPWSRQLEGEFKLVRLLPLQRNGAAPNHP